MLKKFWEFLSWSFAVVLVTAILIMTVSHLNSFAAKLRKVDERQKEITNEQYQFVEKLIQEHPTLKSVVKNAMYDDKIDVDEFEKIQDMKFKSRLKYPE